MNFSDIQNMINNLVQLISNITNALLSNQLFQITIGIIIFKILFDIIYFMITYNTLIKWQNNNYRRKADGYYYLKSNGNYYTKYKTRIDNYK